MSDDYEKYLKRVPLNDHLAALMEEPFLPEEAAEVVALAGEMTEDDREHLRLLLLEPGWRVLLKLLDNHIQTREDAARRTSLSDPLSDNLKEVWADVAYARRAREQIENLAKTEISLMKKAKTSDALLGH